MATVQEHLSQLLSQREFADVVLVATPDGADGEAEEVWANSHILSRSPVLARMFSDGFVEGRSKRAEIPVRLVRHLRDMVRYLYTDSMELKEDAGLEDVVETLALVQRYELPIGAVNLLGARLDNMLENIALGDAIELAGRALAAGVPRQSFQAIAARVVQAAIFGTGEVLRSLAWASFIEEQYGDIIAPSFRQDLLKKVDPKLAQLKAEVEMLPLESGIDVHAVAARSLMLSQFMAVASEALAARTTCFGMETAWVTCSSRVCSHRTKAEVNFRRELVINEEPKAGLVLAAGKMLEDVQTLLAVQRDWQRESQAALAREAASERRERELRFKVEALEQIASPRPTPDLPTAALLSDQSVSVAAVATRLECPLGKRGAAEDDHGIESDAKRQRAVSA